MAITPTGSLGSNKQATGTGITISSWTLPSDADYVVAVLANEYVSDPTRTLSSATLGGNAATGIVEVNHATSRYPLLAMAYWKNSALPTKGSAHDVVFTTEYAECAVCAVQAFKNTSDVAPEASDTNTEHDANDLPIDYSLTTSTANALIVSAACRAGVAGSWTAEDGQTELHDDNQASNIDLVFGYVDAGAAGAKTQGWNHVNNVRWLTCVVAIALVPVTATAALTGTATASITEADIVTGGKTIILTLTEATWVA